jgi:hypothetical protein
MSTTSTHVNYLYLIQGSALSRHWNTLDDIQGRIRAIDDLPEDGMLSVKVSLLRIRDEELRCRGILA